MFKRRLNPVIFLDKRKFKVQEEKNKTIYLSKEIKIKDFKKIIISWNIVTPVDSYVDIEARVLVNNNLKEKYGQNGYLGGDGELILKEHQIVVIVQKLKLM